ncbi:hypothetical protein SUGI_0934400 [Cryptomeria japonica]|nr:hypothetical protein SUGI_0934400 [Cryptomeria japonica]
MTAAAVGDAVFRSIKASNSGVFLCGFLLLDAVSNEQLSIIFEIYKLSQTSVKRDPLLELAIITPGQKRGERSYSS